MASRGFLFSYFFLYPLFIIELADFIFVDFEEGIAFFIICILPLGIFLVGILFIFVSGFATFGNRSRCLFLDPCLNRWLQLSGINQGFSRCGLGFHRSDGINDVLKHRWRGLRYRKFRWLQLREREPS